MDFFINTLNMLLKFYIESETTILLPIQLLSKFWDKHTENVGTKQKKQQYVNTYFTLLKLIDII